MAKRCNGREAGITSAALGAAGAACRLCLRALPLCLLLGGSAYGAACLWSEALADGKLKVGGETLSLEGAATEWDGARREMRRLGALAGGRSVLDPFLASDLRSEYAKSPWVKRVCSVRRVFPDRVAVDFVLRLPAAQIKEAAGGFDSYWTIDGEGVLLPLDAARRPCAGLPVIVSAPAGALPKRPAFGERWTDDGIADALGVMRVLRNSAVAGQVTVTGLTVRRGAFAERVSELAGRPRLEVQTREGVPILWGTFNAGELPGEIASAEKIAMIGNLLDKSYAKPGVGLNVSTRVACYFIPGQSH